MRKIQFLPTIILGLCVIVLAFTNASLQRQNRQAMQTIRSQMATIEVQDEALSSWVNLAHRATAQLERCIGVTAKK